ncbi:dehydrogenase/reductase-like protein [Dermatophagoides farinae]|uniref:Dehydrogenase/reductase-like protein n=1 Tax=Dermatophagoides farinae TaxID=6954 RepID=A0A9D4P6I4_DERFA|nr:dehydrogenase/reductase-like protein [Dermatophagoides farinae]
MLAINDYKFWHLMYGIFPTKIIDTVFTIITAIQLYLLGARYVLKEIRRKLSTKVRKLSSNEPDIPNDLTNHVAVVTGGSRGIGLSAAKDLYRRGCIVIVTSSASSQLERDKMAEEARESVRPTINGGNILVWPIDFREMSSVFDFVARFNKEYGYLDILINNAGVMFVDKNFTTDGFEYHYQINYLSHVLLTWLLLPALNKTNEKMVQHHTPYSPFHAYAQSKLCQIMFTYYMADWLRTDVGQSYRILINSLHPGVAMTGLYQYVWWVRLFPWLASFLFRTADEGAETVIYCALSTEIESSGYYYEDCARLRSSKFSLNKIYQNRLAELTRKQLAKFIENYNQTYPEFKVPQILAY